MEVIEWHCEKIGVVLAGRGNVIAHPIHFNEGLVLIKLVELHMAKSIVCYGHYNRAAWSVGVVIKK